MSEHTVEEKVLLILAVIVGTFLLFSILAGFILAIRGIDTGGVWEQTFNLVNVLAGALVGYVSGTYLTRTQVPPNYGDQSPKTTEEEGHM